MKNNNKKPVGIIYRAISLENNMSYVGLTTKSLKSRIKQHLREALENDSDKYFHRVLREHGENAFHWEVLEKAYNLEELSNKEIKWIAYYDSFSENGMNRSAGGEVGSIGSTKSREFARDKSELMHQLRAEGKIPHSTGDAIGFEKAIEIKDLVLSGLTNEEISERLDISLAIVAGVKNGSTWRVVVTDEDVKAMENTVTQEDTKMAHRVRDMLLESTPIAEIANTCGISSYAIREFRKGLKWRGAITDEDFAAMSKTMPMRKEKSIPKTITERKILQVKDLILSGCFQNKEIADMCDIKAVMVSNIKTGRNHSHLFTPEELQQMKTRKLLPLNKKK